MNSEIFAPLPPRAMTVGTLIGDGVLLGFGARHFWLNRESGNGAFPSLAAWRGEADRTLLLIGRLGERPCYALGNAEVEMCPPECVPVEFREALRALTAAERQALSRALELQFWRRRHRLCGACGAENHFCEDQVAARCPACGELYFPQIAPAVIVAIRRESKLLLAHNRNFRPGMFSLIAGFVEAGESLEEAVRREIREEVGIEVEDIRYFGSQTWPFPNSLMVGFSAVYAGGELRPDGEEITEADFFRPGEFPDIPSPGSISRELIDAFVAGRLG